MVPPSVAGHGVLDAVTEVATGRLRWSAEPYDVFGVGIVVAGIVVGAVGLAVVIAAAKVRHSSGQGLAQPLHAVRGGGPGTAGGAGTHDVRHQISAGHAVSLGPQGQRRRLERRLVARMTYVVRTYVDPPPHGCEGTRFRPETEVTSVGVAHTVPEAGDRVYRVRRDADPEVSSAPSVAGDEVEDRVRSHAARADEGTRDESRDVRRAALHPPRPPGRYARLERELDRGLDRAQGEAGGRVVSGVTA